jgi:hypothetical protein
MDACAAAYNAAPHAACAMLAHTWKDTMAQRKENRIWAQRSEAVAVLAANPKASAADVIAALFQSKPETIASEVTTFQRKLAAEYKAELARKQAVIDASAASDKQAASK